MYDEIECPYCKKYFEVNCDDGRHYNDGESQSDECPHCGKGIMIYSSCIWNREANKADCLNGSDHNWSKPRIITSRKNDDLKEEVLEVKYCYDCYENHSEWVIKDL